MRIEKASEIGFCFGVKRAIDILERIAHERGRVETLGAVVHNQQVLQRLAGVGVRVAICYDIRKRQAAALKLAKAVDLMLVIGDHTSANTNRLAEICSIATKTYLVETSQEIQPSWLQGRCHIGITGGASTAEQTINEVVMKLQALT